MALDLKTLIFCNFILGAFLVVLLLLYRARQRTYPGYLASVFSARRGRENHLYRLFSILYVLVGTAVLLRALLWMTNPLHGLFDWPFFHTAYFSLTLVAGTGAAICSLLLTSQRLEQEVRTGEERFRKLVEASTMGIVFLREEPGDRLTVTGANPAACAILRLPEDPLSRRLLREAFPGEAAEGMEAGSLRTSHTGEPFHKEGAEYRDGRIARILDLFAYRTGPGRAAMLFNDISEGKRQEAERMALQARERQMATVENRGRLVHGLAHEIQGSLLEPFVTSRAGRAGLGLALARRYLRSHGGDRTGRNRKPALGSVFTATLPFRPEPNDPTEAAEASRIFGG